MLLKFGCCHHNNIIMGVVIFVVVFINGEWTSLLEKHGLHYRNFKKLYYLTDLVWSFLCVSCDQARQQHLCSPWLALKQIHQIWISWIKHICLRNHTTGSDKGSQKGSCHSANSPKLIYLHTFTKLLVLNLGTYTQEQNIITNKHVDHCAKQPKALRSLQHPNLRKNIMTYTNKNHKKIQWITIGGKSFRTVLL